MNAVDNYYYSFNTQMPDNPYIEVPYRHHGGKGESNTPARKRPRESPVSFLGDDISSQLLHQTQKVDHLILYHSSNMRAELLARRQSIVCQTLATVEEGLSKRLKAKDEEIQRIGKLNWVLEEQVGLLCLDCQVWRELAHTNEAAAVGLRSDLEEVLAARVPGMTEGAESCCGGDEEQNQGDTTGSRSRIVCGNCRGGRRRFCCCRAGIFVCAAVVGRL